MARELPASRNPAGHSGLISNVVALLAALADFFGSRAALFATESKTALVHIVVLLACVIGALAFIVFGYVFLIVALVVGIAHVAHISAVWTVLGAGVVHIIIAAVLGAVVVARMKTPLYPSTMAELTKDREWLKTLPNQKLS